MKLGFYDCGVSRAEPVAQEDAEIFLQTLANGGFAGMDYMAKNVDKRLDPTLLMPGAKAIISVALNYTPAQRIPQDQYQIATYAYGRDYHDVMKQRLYLLAARLELQNFRVFCDTAPILERYWAAKAGIGWIGKNHQLIVPGVGSRVFLGEIITTESLPQPLQGGEKSYQSLPLGGARRGLSQANKPREVCMNCGACLRACPLKAINETVIFDASKCLSYQTIENRGDIPSEVSALMADCFYGCDRCIDACPYNKNATPTTIPELQPTPKLLLMTKEDWHNLTEEQYHELFKGSAVKRAKYTGLTRNINKMK